MTNYRNAKMLALANDAPHCMYCRELNHGHIVGCHSNSIKHGKGMGIKAHDLVAYLCNHCHDIIDGRLGPHMSKRDRDAMFYEGAYETVLWLLINNHLELT